MIGPQFNRHMVRMRFSALIIGIIRCLLFSLLILVLGINFACSELDMYFPPQDGDWETVTPEEVGWNAVALENAMAFAGEYNSSGIVILHRGRILAERYWKISGTDADVTSDGRPIEDVASVQKSVVSLLTGIALERGLLQLDMSVSSYLDATWSEAPREFEEHITLRHLLSMTSGLTRGLEYEAPAGERWLYSTSAYKHLIEVLTKVSRVELSDYTSEWLTVKIGMKDSRWVTRAGKSKNSYGFVSSTRDLARLGLLILAEGAWDGDMIVSESYLRETLRSSQSMNPAFGFLFWVNGQDDWMDVHQNNLRPGSFIPTAPNDLVAARGDGDRRVYVVPSLNIVITRLGASAVFKDGKADYQFFDREFWRKLMKAARPSSNSRPTSQHR